ncbi:MAG: hypothetical protein ACI311_06310 [Bacilli bacterium]
MHKEIFYEKLLYIFNNLYFLSGTLVFSNNESCQPYFINLNLLKKSSSFDFQDACIIGNPKRIFTHEDLINIAKRKEKDVFYYNLYDEDNCMIFVDYNYERLNSFFLKTSNELSQIEKANEIKNYILYVKDLLSNNINSKLTYFNNANESNLSNTIENYINVKNDGFIRSIFTTVKQGKTKKIGYADILYRTNPYRINDFSSLVILETHSSFTPGYVAYRDMNDNDYEWAKNLRLSKGKIAIKPYQIIDEVGYNQIRYGGQISLKDYYPSSDTSTVQITTTFGNEFTKGITVGFSENDGLSVEGSNGKSITYAYSKSFSANEPKMNAAIVSNDINKIQWNFAYKDPYANGKETFHMNTGYIFEIQNSQDMVNETDFYFDLDVSFSAKNIFTYTDDAE